jgi:hypothetical protein
MPEHDRSIEMYIMVFIPTVMQSKDVRCIYKFRIGYDMFYTLP